MRARPAEAIVIARAQAVRCAMVAAVAVRAVMVAMAARVPRASRSRAATEIRFSGEPGRFAPRALWRASDTLSGVELKLVSHSSQQPQFSQKSRSPSFNVSEARQKREQVTDFSRTFRSPAHRHLPATCGSTRAPHPGAPAQPRSQLWPARVRARTRTHRRGPAHVGATAPTADPHMTSRSRSEEHTSELQSR